MLFLAVFCGFLAEWKLEHVIEHSREHEYMESMIVDIKTDETNLSGMKSTFAYVSSHIDSLILLLQDQAQLDMNAAKIYQHQVYLNLFQKWIYADRTIDQLKNSGIFRLIRNRLVSDRIIKYDGIIRNNIRDMQLNLLQKQSQGIIEAGTDIFKSSVFKEYYMNGGFSYHPVVLPKAPYFLTHNEITLQKFINKLDQYSVSIDWFKSFIDIAIKEGNQVDSIIKKEYHIE